MISVLFLMVQGAYVEPGLPIACQRAEINHYNVAQMLVIYNNPIIHKDFQIIFFYLALIKRLKINQKFDY